MKLNATIEEKRPVSDANVLSQSVSPEECSGGRNKSRKVSFIVPTLRRPAFLERCLIAIANQTVRPARILVGVRPDDTESLAVIAQYERRIPVECVKVYGIGVVGSMAACLQVVKSEFVALIDDDVELPENWTAKMSEHLERDVKMAAAAGKDLLQDYPEMRKNESKTLDVGRFHWYGKITGDHHRGGGLPRRVDVLRGSNCLFRSEFLRTVGFEAGLRGRGAQVHWELALALQAKQLGFTLFFDPTVGVVHHTAPRHDNDKLHRGILSEEALLDINYNESYVVSAHASRAMRITNGTWSILVGGGHSVGFLKYLHLVFKKNPDAWTLWRTSLKGRVQGWHAGWRIRQAKKR